MQQKSKVFVGLDTSKLKISVAVAEDGRQGEIRFLGKDLLHLSERDINVARTLKSVTLDKAKVELVMSTPPLTVPPDARLSDVAARMIDRKAGSAVVVHEGRIVGIFTSHDALHALHRLLAVSG